MSELPTGWSMATLSQVADWGSGGTPRAGDPRYYGGPIPWAVIGDLTDGVVLRTASSLTEQGLAESSAKVVEPGTVLVAMYGASIGKLGITGERMATNQAIACAWPHSVDRKYLFWFLRSERSQLSAAGKGAAQPNISQTILRSWPVRVAPIDEQRRIVAAIEMQFSRLDAAEMALTRASQRVRALRQACFSLAISEGDERRLGDLLDKIEAGKSFKCEPRAAYQHEWGVVKVSAMTWGSFDESQNKAVLDAARVDPRWEIRPGDLLLSRANTADYVGATVLVGECRNRLLLSDKSMRLRVKPDIEAAWLQLALSALESRSQMSAVATGTSDSMRNISQEKVRNVLLRVPSRDDQRMIVAEVERRLSLVDALAAAIDRATRGSAALRRAVLERAFSGTLVPQDSADEPASVLLERIAAAHASESNVVRRRRRAVA